MGCGTQVQGGWVGWDGGGELVGGRMRGDGGGGGGYEMGAVHQNATSLHSPCGPPNFRESGKDIRSNK